MTTATLTPPPRQTANPAPVRAARSIRRTTSIDVSWPDGPTGQRLMQSRARDALTGEAGSEPQTLAHAEVDARLSFDKTITAISASPSIDGVEGLVGVRAGNHLRFFVRENMPALAASGDPLYLLLDDMSGTALVSSWALTHWHPDLMGEMQRLMPPDQLQKYMDRAGVCWGLKPGSSGLEGGMPRTRSNPADAGELRNPADPEGWHLFPASEGAGFRRARRIEVRREDGLIEIDAAFQDSAPMPEGGRGAIHEYLLRVTADAETLAVLSLAAEPRVLPFPECPGAVANAQRLVGATLPAIRDAVLAQLRGPEGCTHLNDALRALADVPRLLAQLDG
jgi:Protein of unknown function (DUF2889)